MSYSNGRFRTGGGFVSPSDAQTRDANQQAADEAQLARDELAGVGERIKADYRRSVAPPYKQVGPTSFDMGRGLSDYAACERCFGGFGYARSLYFLRDISPRAKALFAARNPTR